MEKVYYRIKNKSEYLRVIGLAPDYISRKWNEGDWSWISTYINDDVFIGWDNQMEYSRQEWPFANEGYQLKPVYNFKEYLNQIEEC